MNRRGLKVVSLLTALLLTAAIVAGCAGSASGDDQSGTAKVKIGVFNNETAETSGWTKAQYDGFQYLQEKLGDKVEVVWVENVPDTGSDATAVIDELAEQDCQIIIGTSYGVLSNLVEAAKKYPDIKFYHCQSTSYGDNFSVYDVRNYEAIFVTGYLAGLMSQNDYLGYVATQPMPTVLRAVNAFALGAKYARPEAKVQVIFTNSWYDTTAEAEAANALISEGATVLGMHTSSPAVPQAAEKANVLSVGFQTDMYEYAPKSVMTSFIWNWGPILVHEVETYLDNTWEASDTFWGLDKGCGGYTEFNKDLVPEDVAAKVKELEAKLNSGELSVFAGEIKDNEGNVRAAAGQELSDDEIRSMDWLVENVIGSIG
jgi:basic membrane protein A